MEIIPTIVDYFLHFDTYLLNIIGMYGVWTNVILFFVIFITTGLVVIPFMPGDSILFAAGAFAAIGSLNIWVTFFILFVAAVTGNLFNYWLGKIIGKNAFERNYKLLNKRHLKKTNKFYEKHGGQAIILARFVPIVRTFAPFVAGIGSMDYWRFLTFTVIGAFSWVALFLFGGYFFGNIPVVKENFSTVILAIIVISFLPIVIEYTRDKRNKAKPHA